MGSHAWIARFAALALAAGAPSIASATSPEIERQIREAQERMQRLDDELQAASDQLEAATQRVEEQTQLIEGSGLVQSRGATSGLPGILGEITIGGSVSATYFYNLNDPNDAENGGLGNTNSGINGPSYFYPLHPDHNSFAFQALWLEIEREISEEKRGGFVFETAWGKTGQLNNLGGIGNRCTGGCANSDDTGLYLSQGYVQYLAPIGDGVTFKMGKFGTTIGYEVANSVYNWNITQGNVYQLLEPLDHIGIIAEYTFGDSGFDASLGGVNGFFPNDPDHNDAKSILGHVGWSNDSLSVGVNGIWGGETAGFDGDELGVVNGVVTWDATDRLSFWLNGDYMWADDTSGDAWGIAAAGRFGITDRTGIALRGEYVADSDDFYGLGGFDPTDPSNPDALVATGFEIWGITATLDHLLTDHLMIRGEVRYDNIDKDDTDNAEFLEDSSEFDNDQIVLGVEAIYNFTEFGGE